MSPADPFYKKTITFPFDGGVFSFDVSQELFSSHVVDHGTQRLLRSLLKHQSHSCNKILDLGCGYGPLGIVLKTQHPNASVHFVDRDALALEYSRQNTLLNGITDQLTFSASLGFDNIQDNNFDLIVSNIPAKVGNQVLSHFLKDAQHYLTENGNVAIVVVDEINDFVFEELNNDENIQIHYHQNWPGHHVYHYSFINHDSPLSPAFESGEYVRNAINFIFQKNSFPLETTYHLQEFDQISFETELILNKLTELKPSKSKVAILYPGQGYIPLICAHYLQSKQFFLVDRDLQALKTSETNLLRLDPSLKITPRHQSQWEIGEKSVDLVVSVIPEKQNKAVYELLLSQVQQNLTDNGEALFSSTSTTIKRLEEIQKKKKIFTIISREKNKGKSIIYLRKN